MNDQTDPHLITVLRHEPRLWREKETGHNYEVSGTVIDKLFDINEREQILFKRVGSQYTQFFSRPAFNFIQHFLPVNSANYGAAKT